MIRNRCAEIVTHTSGNTAQQEHDAKLRIVEDLEQALYYRDAGVDTKEDESDEVDIFQFISYVKGIEKWAWLFLILQKVKGTSPVSTSRVFNSHFSPALLQNAFIRASARTGNSCLKILDRTIYSYFTTGSFHLPLSVSPGRACFKLFVSFSFISLKYKTGN